MIARLVFGGYRAVLLSETFLTESTTENHQLKGFYLYNRERDDDGTSARGGVAVGILDDGAWKHQLYHQSEEGAKAETITIKLTSSDEKTVMYLTSIYIPPDVSISEEELVQSLPGDISEEANWVIGGDANAHHPIWDSFVEEDSRGRMLKDFAIANKWLFGNEEEMPTRTVTRKTGKHGKMETKLSSPDVTMMRNVEVLAWHTELNLESDHNWITYEISGEQPQAQTKRRFWQLNKAKWGKFRDAARALFHADKKRSIESLSAAILQAMKQSIPKGRNPNVTPIWTDRMAQARDAAEAANREAKCNPSIETVEAARTAKDEMNTVFRDERRRVFWEKFKAMKEDNGNVWRLLRNAQRKSQISGHTVVLAEDKTELRTDRAKAKAFVRRYAKVSARTGPVANKYDVRDAEYNPLTWDEWRVALRKMGRRKAVAPTDEIPIEAIENLHESEQRTLLEAFNRSYELGHVPLIWKRGTIIPALKPQKSAADIASYRPVTLTSQLSKLMERIIARRIIFQIHKNLHGSQFGFKDGHSTVDALMDIIDEIVWAFDSEGMHQKRKTHQRALGIAVDFSSAFDTIGHHEVLEELLRKGCGSYELRWVRSFLTGRQGQVQVGEKTSDWTDFEAGVPQGTVLGPLLFIVAVDGLLKELHAKGFKCVAFADDLTMIFRNIDLDKCVEKAQKALDIIDNWTKRSCMIVNVKKTFGMVFTRGKSEMELDDITLKLKYQGQTVRIFTPSDPPEEAMTIDQSRLLGLHFDSKLHFPRQVTKVKHGTDKARQCMSIMSGHTMGADTKMLTEFHTAFVRSKILYGIECYWHLMSASQRERLCQIDREGLRQAVGMMPGTKTENLHYESGARPLSIEVKMRQAIYYERVSRLGLNQTKRALKQPPAATGMSVEYIQTGMNTCKLAAEEILKSQGVKTARLERAPLVMVSPIAPWMRKDDGNIRIVTNVAAGKRKGDLTKEQQRQIVEEVVRKHLETATHHSFTDGSSHIKRFISGAAGTLYVKVSDSRNSANGESMSTASATSNSGFGHEHSANGENQWEKVGSVRVAGGPFSCSFTTESMGLKKLLELILERSIEGAVIVIFIDCKSLLDDLEERSIDQKEMILVQIWELLLKVGARNEVRLQHIWSHCGVEGNEEVDKMADEAAKTLPQENIPLSFRDSRALIKKWAKEEARKLSEVELPEVVAKTKQEKTWSREEQVVAAQIRAGKVRHVGEWPRRFDERMSMSCRFCAPQDHVRAQAKTEAAGPRGHRDKIKCVGCGHEYSRVEKYNDHLKKKSKAQCVEKGAKPVELRKREKKAKLPVERDKATGPEETLYHVINECETVRKQWPHDGTLKGMVGTLIVIRQHLDMKKKNELDEIRKHRLRKKKDKQQPDDVSRPEAPQGRPLVPHGGERRDDERGNTDPQDPRRHQPAACEVLQDRQGEGLGLPHEAGHDGDHVGSRLQRLRAAVQPRELHVGQVPGGHLHEDDQGHPGSLRGAHDVPEGGAVGDVRRLRPQGPCLPVRGGSGDSGVVDLQ